MAWQPILQVVQCVVAKRRLTSQEADFPQLPGGRISKSPGGYVGPGGQPLSVLQVHQRLAGKYGILKVFCCFNKYLPSISKIKNVAACNGYSTSGCAGDCYFTRAIFGIPENWPFSVRPCPVYIPSAPRAKHHHHRQDRDISPIFMHQGPDAARLKPFAIAGKRNRHRLDKGARAAAGEPRDEVNANDEMQVRTRSGMCRPTKRCTFGTRSSPSKSICSTRWSWT